jgi:hypothetical protein
MRVRFPRLADGQRSFSVVERSDGVRYRVHQGRAGPELPHDVVHFVVEREMEEDGGFWGAIAAGPVFSSMEHLDGRRPPHAKDRSALAKRARSDRLQRAELTANLVERIAAEGITSVDGVARTARETLSTLPDARVDEARVIAAAKVLQDTACRWASLAPGDELDLDWPEKSRRRHR